MGGDENGREEGEDTDGSRRSRISKGNLKQKCLPLYWVVKGSVGEGGKARWLCLSNLL